MKKLIITAAALSLGIIAGCGGGGSTPATSILGKVADGYLVNATVFMDKNNNYQLDAGEPSTTTDANGAFTLNIDSADLGKYPIVAMAIKGQTIDRDINAAVSNSYVMSAPAGATGFISPMSTLIREKMAVNQGMTLNDAMIQLRNQMNLPLGIDMMADYVVASQSGTTATQYLTMRTTAQQMAGLMAGQAALVMNVNGSSVNLNRYRGMMATINSNMPAITANAGNSAFMASMMTTMQTQLGTISMSGFMNYSGMFRNITSHSSFWSSAGAPMTPMSGGMMR